MLLVLCASDIKLFDDGVKYANMACKLSKNSVYLTLQIH
jgi:hypothetical protein